MFGPGLSVGLMMCDGYAPVPHRPMAMDMPMDAGMDMSTHATGQAAEPLHGRLPDSTGRGSPAQQSHSACPYGASPVLAGAPALATASLEVGRSPDQVLPAPQLTAFQSIARAQSPRAPPIHS
jgi:hypothetical protein